MNKYAQKISNSCRCLLIHKSTILQLSGGWGVWRPSGSQRLSDFLAFGAAHCVWRACFVVFGSHLLHAPTRWIHIRDVGDFTSGWACTALLLAVRTVRSLCATRLVLRVRVWCGSSSWLCWFRRLVERCRLLLGRYHVHDAGHLHELWLCEFSEDGL